MQGEQALKKTFRLRAQRGTDFFIPVFVTVMRTGELSSKLNQAFLWGRVKKTESKVVINLWEGRCRCGKDEIHSQ